MVGNSSLEPYAVHPFLYTGTPGVDGHMIDLDAWLDATNPAEGANWTLGSALSITDNGLITGEGYHAGAPGTRAYLLDASSLIPEPSTAAMAMISAAAIFARRPPATRP